MAKMNIQIGGNVTGSVNVAGGESLTIINGKVVKPEPAPLVLCVFCGTRTSEDVCPKCGANPQTPNVK